MGEIFQDPEMGKRKKKVVPSIAARVRFSIPLRVFLFIHLCKSCVYTRNSCSLPAAFRGFHHSTAVKMGHPGKSESVRSPRQLPRGRP